MARLNHIVLSILILQIYVHAAPNDVSKLEEIAKVEQADPQIDSETKEVESDNNSTETQRQKRWYNPYEYGLPSFNPFINPGYNKRDDGTNTGYYGGEDPLAHIHRRIQEIAHFVRQPQQPPPPHIPIYFPVLFIPPGDCNCNNENQNPTTPEPNSSVTPTNEDTTPDVVSRWPVMEDNRQNWGFVVNESDSEEGVEFSRPISFDPIRLNSPMRPAPPVEHGSVQSDSTAQDQLGTEAPSSQIPPSRPQDKTTMQPTQNRPQNSPSSQNRSPSGLAPPSSCEGAILTCCHQPQVVYECFAIQGCPDFTSYGNPCDPNLILRVIATFQNYYGQKSK